jgi:uncharacterized protein YxeA
LFQFYGKWYQAFYYSSDGQKTNNCSTVEVNIKPSNYLTNLPMVFFNQSRVDRGLFHRFSWGQVSPPPVGSSGADMEVTFDYEDAPRRRKFLKIQNNTKYIATK